MDDLFTFSNDQGGMGYLQPVEVMTESILQHIQKGLLHDDVIRDIILSELHQSKDDWLCTTWDDIMHAILHPWNQSAHNMWLRLDKDLQFCNMWMSLSSVLKDWQESGELSGVRDTHHLPVWAMWNLGNHGGSVSEEERSNFLTVTHWRTLCQGERILSKHKQVLWIMDLRDVRKLSREKRGGELKIPWLLCKRMSCTDQNENLIVMGKDMNQEVRVCLSRTAGISLDDNTVLQKYLDLVD